MEKSPSRSAASMFEIVCSGPITWPRSVAAIARETPTESRVRVHSVGALKSPAHSSTRPSASPGAPTRNARARTRRSKTMSLQAAIERAARQPQRLRGFSRVAARAAERFADQHPLDVLETHRVERAAPVGGPGECQVAHPDFGALGKQHGALDGVIELAHVAGPRVAQQRLHRLGGECEADLAIAGAVALQEVRREPRHVLPAFA